MGITSDNLIIILGLLIPFLGILFPILILFLFQVSRPEAPTAEAAPTEEATDGAPRAWPTPVPGGRAVPGDKRPILIDSAELTWFRDRLRESDVFEGLTDSELRYIAAIGHRRKVSAGERLAEGGSRGDTLFVILEGALRLLTHTPPEIPVRIAHAGETVPLAVIITPPVLVTTVEAAMDGEVFAMPRKRLLDLFERQPLIGFQVFRAAAKIFEHRYRMTLDRGGAVSEGPGQDT
jgi:hypothetical protein